MTAHDAGYSKLQHIIRSYVCTIVHAKRKLARRGSREEKEKKSHIGSAEAEAVTLKGTHQKLRKNNNTNYI